MRARRTRRPPVARQPHYWAFVIHRASGVLLTLFLPAHFWALSLAIKGEARLESFIHWTEQPLVKAAESMLVLLLSAHLTGGIRILVLEFLPWHRRQKTALALTLGLTLAVGLTFLLGIV